MIIPPWMSAPLNCVLIYYRKFPRKVSDFLQTLVDSGDVGARRDAFIFVGTWGRDVCVIVGMLGRIRIRGDGGTRRFRMRGDDGTRRVRVREDVGARRGPTAEAMGYSIDGLRAG